MIRVDLIRNRAISELIFLSFCAKQSNYTSGHSGFYGSLTYKEAHYAQQDPFYVHKLNLIVIYDYFKISDQVHITLFKISDQNFI